MRVAYDAAPLLDRPTGVGRYTRELAHALELLGIDLARFAVAYGAPTDTSIARWRIPARVARALWKRFDAPAIERLTGPVDVVHGTNFVLPALGDGAGVVTVHDLSFLRDDTWRGGERLRKLVPWSIERAARVLVPTRTIASEVEDRYGAAGKIVVVSEGVAPVFFGATPLADTVLAGRGITRPFTLAAGTLEPRKNLARLLRAWELARDDLRDWTLVLAGPKGWGPDLPETRGVVPLGWVGDETLPGLLAAADLFCYPSLYEGFGLPPLEAMAAGTAVVAGSYPAAAEVLGDAAVLVDPHDVDGLAVTLAELAGDEALRRRLALGGRAHAATFTWEAAAAATIAAYKAAIVHE